MPTSANDDEEASFRCAVCRKELRLSENVLAMQEGVIGPRGFVDLDDPLYFCNEECAKKHCEDVDRPTLPRRIP